MSSDAVVSVVGLGKDYTIGTGVRGGSTLREVLVHATQRVTGRRGSHAAAPDDRSLLCALDGLTFDIMAGEAVGFIGHNGAGKSTLLKVLSRVTEPTRGHGIIAGRVGALLEVGTGFHPELTGRENVFLNGALLGMTKAEVVKRFDEIVAFADVERFLDTPVKRYSSGMYVRLAFAVAAHLEPEILIIDEVLAVGDTAFQRKCLGRMSEVARSGRTVLFVSHSMSVVQALCSRAIVLEQGRLVHDGPVDGAVQHYLSTLEAAATTSVADRRDRKGYWDVLATRVVMTGSNGASLSTGAPARLEIQLTGLLPGTTVEVTLLNQLGLPVLRFASAVSSSEDTICGSEPAFTCDVDALPLVPGRYRLDLLVRGGGHLQDELPAALFIDVAEGSMGGRPVSSAIAGAGDVVVRHRWSMPDV